MENNKITSYNYSLSSLKDYTGTLENKKELTEFLNKISPRVRHKILNVLINYFRSINNEELTKYYYDLRSDLFKEQEDTNKGDALLILIIKRN